MKGAFLCSLALLARPVFPCGCQSTVPVCNEVAYSSAVFIGTVESISPIFLEDWSLSRRPSLQQLNLANERFLSDRSPQNLATLKDIFRRTFPDLPEEQRGRLDKADSQKSLVDLFSAVLGHGKRVRFRVSTVFRNGDDDHGQKAKDKEKDAGKDAKAKDDDDDAKDQVFDVWTPFGDCGFDFQTGETYLVYADSDEDTNIMETDSCTRTRRLSDAGGDLAYLYFYKERKAASARLEGFTTFDTLYQVKQRDADKIDSPVPGVTVGLKSASGMRYTHSDPSGKFLFDGLEAGDYQLSGYAPGFPDTVKLLSGPKRFHIDARGCSNQVLLIPKEP
ncbi:MAG: carboxypeptidase-like regulatory domain-containing protein [Bryobacteraceae bacterium]